MRMRFFFTVLVLAGACRPAWSAFEDYFPSARAAALGGAFTAMADDPVAIFYNPASAALIEGKQGSFSYARLYAGLDGVTMSLNQFAYAQKIGTKAGGGIGWSSFQTKDLYREDIALLSSALNAREIFKIPGFDGELAVGVSGKYLRRRFELDDRTRADPVFRGGGQVQSGTMDVSIYAVPDPERFPGLSLGLAVRNVTRANVGFGVYDPLPKEVAGGLAWKWKGLCIPLDITARAGDLRVRGGAEYLIANRIAVRAGSDTDQVGGGAGYRHVFSERFSVVFDYAFLWPLKMEQKAGSHRATFGIKF